jgi:hypothetical protein
MANDSTGPNASLLTKCYPFGSLPPEVDGEGNIEYKVTVPTFMQITLLLIHNKAQANKSIS